MTRPTGSAATDDQRPRLRVVAGETDTHRDVPIGTSDRKTIDEKAPTREVRTDARARINEDRPATQRCKRALRVVRSLAAYMDPPDVWAEDRPSLRKQWNYARWGEQHPPDGLLRGPSIALCCLGLLPQALAYYVAWIAERPGRLLASYALLALVLQIPVVRAVLTAAAAVAVAPLSWLV